LTKNAYRTWGDFVAMIKTVFSGKIKKAIYENFTFQKLVLGLFFFIALTTLIFFSSLPQKYDVKVGEVLQESIIARKDAINTIATNQLKQAAADAVPKKYTLNHTITVDVKNQVARSDFKLC